MMIHHAGCQRCHMTLGTWVKRPRVATWWTQITGVLLNASSSLFFFFWFLCVNKNTGGLLKPGWIQGTRSTSTQGCPWQGYPNWHPAPSSRYLDPGNLSAQLALRNTCLPWSWYMTKVTFPGKTFSSSQVAPLALKHHPAPPANLAWGEVYQVGTVLKCWTSKILNLVHLLKNWIPPWQNIARSTRVGCAGGQLAWSHLVSSLAAGTVILSGGRCSGDMTPILLFHHPFETIFGPKVNLGFQFF